MAAGLTADESKALLALCRTGRLYEIEDSIRTGRSLRIAEGVRGTPLQIALAKGFRGLIELLVRNESHREEADDLRVPCPKNHFERHCRDLGSVFNEQFH